MKTIKYLVACLAFVIASVAGGFAYSNKALAACSATTDYGSVTSTVNVPEAATYRVWTRMMVPDTSHATYLMEIDGSTCFWVGGASIAPNTWTWVDYYNPGTTLAGNTNNKTNATLTKGNHTFKLIGKDENVKIDRILLASDLNCVPTTASSSCNTSSDTSPPQTVITAPADRATISDKTSITATATDTGGSVTKVEFYKNSSLLATDTSAPYVYEWDVANVADADYTITAKAYDAANNVGSDSITLTVKHTDKQAPTAPTNVKASAASYNEVNVSWSASTDNDKVNSYMVLRNDSPVAQLSSTTLSYKDKTVAPNTSYTYRVKATDASGNTSAVSDAATVKTPNVPTPDTQAPTVPGNLTATVKSQTQINLAWTASTDNIIVAGYEVYQAMGDGAPTKIADVTTPSYGASGLTANTTYSYSVKAKDGAGNVSEASSVVTAKTLSDTTPTTRSAVISGVIRDRATNAPIKYSRAITTVQGVRFIYRTGTQGFYRISHLPADRYNVVYRAHDYDAQTIPVFVNDGEQKSQDAALQRSR